MSTFRLNKQLFNPALYSRVHEVWFGGLPAGATSMPPELLSRWFGAGASAQDKSRFDDVCHEGFHAALDSVGPTAYPLPSAPTSWAAEQQQAGAIAAPFLETLRAEEPANGGGGGAGPDAAAALSLLLPPDQIPRNIFRSKQALIYDHYDRLARAVLHSLLRREPRVDLHPSVRYSPPLRQWFYMPLMHSEHLEDHKLFAEILAAFRADVAGQGDDPAVQAVGMTADFEKRHVAIIERFGRYPHRNEHLRREPSAEETEYLEVGGERF